jgi:hypothetical protein
MRFVLVKNYANEVKPIISYRFNNHLRTWKWEESVQKYLLQRRIGGNKDATIWKKTMKKCKLVVQFK